MKTSIWKFALVFGAFAGLIGIQTTSASAATDGGRLGVCRMEGQAKGLKGAELKTSMKACKTVARKACKQEMRAARTVKADRHSFMKSCLKGGAAPASPSAPSTSPKI